MSYQTASITGGNWNYFELSGFRVIGVLNKKTRNTWFRRFSAYTRFIVTLWNFEGKKKHVIDFKSELGKTDKWWQTTDWFQITRHYFSSPGRTVKTVCLRTYKSCDIGKGQFVITHNWDKFNLPAQNVMAHWSAKLKIDVELSRVKLQRKQGESWP